MSHRPDILAPGQLNWGQGEPPHLHHNRRPARTQRTDHAPGTPDARPRVGAGQLRYPDESSVPKGRNRDRMSPLEAAYGECRFRVLCQVRF